VTVDYSMAERSALVSRVVDAVRTVVGDGPVALHEPHFGGNESRYLQECLDTTMVSSIGPFVDRFEAGLAAYTGAGYAIAVVNGTAALQVALQLAGVMPGDEVLCPALTFVATANAVTYCGGIPHFVDSDVRTLGVDVPALREYLHMVADVRNGECINRATGRAIRAIVPMHAFGHPVDLEPLLVLAGDLNLAVVEDAAESLGSLYHGRHTGTWGRLATLSFNGNKTITTGGGGAILTDDPALARRAKHLTTTARVPHGWEYCHDEVGYNYRMPNINAALGCAQLEQLPDLIAAKRLLFDRYAQAFAGVAGMRVMREPDGCCSNYWLQALILDDANTALRNEVLSATNEAGFMTRPVWTLMHRLAPFRAHPRMPLSCAEMLEAQVINLPSSAQLAMGARA
jgi:perosamine synthetase